MKRVLDTLAVLALFATAVDGTAVPACAQSLAAGRLLVATPDMQDDNFQKSVVLVLHHDDNGTLGILVNRPTWVKPHDVDPDFGDLDGYDGAVFSGGPVSVTQMIFLTRDPPAGAIDAQPIFDHVYAGGNPEQLPKLIQASPDTQKLRLYAGHAEWGGGQLEREIAAGQWVVVDGSADRIFTPDATTLWDRIFHKGSELSVRAAPAIGTPAGAGGVASAAAAGSAVSAADEGLGEEALLSPPLSPRQPPQRLAAASPDPR
jgi:putative transcriptional regulator